VKTADPPPGISASQETPPVEPKSGRRQPRDVGSPAPPTEVVAAGLTFFFERAADDRPVPRVDHDRERRHPGRLPWHGREAEIGVDLAFAAEGGIPAAVGQEPDDVALRPFLPRPRGGAGDQRPALGIDREARDSALTGARHDGDLAARAEAPGDLAVGLEGEEHLALEDVDAAAGSELDALDPGSRFRGGGLGGPAVAEAPIEPTVRRGGSRAGGADAEQEQYGHEQRSGPEPHAPRNRRTGPELRGRRAAAGISRARGRGSRRGLWCGSGCRRCWRRRW
jgi:hypothetical protein